jgi:hypothetical protein
MTSISKSNGKPIVIDCDQVNVKRLSFTELDGNRNKTQQICFPYYEYMPGTKKNFLFKTGPIKIVQYGIPGITEHTERWIKSDDDRAYVRIPYDETQKDCVNLFQMLLKIDDVMINNFQQKIFGSNANKYKYVPLVKDPPEIDDIAINSKNRNVPQKPRLRFCKAKFDTDFNDKKILTGIFVKIDGKAVKQSVTTMTDVHKFLCWNSTARFVLLMNKLWANKTMVNGQRNFGLMLKCLQVEITEMPESRLSIKEAFRNSCIFDDYEPQQSDANSEANQIANNDPNSPDQSIMNAEDNYYNNNNNNNANNENENYNYSFNNNGDDDNTNDDSPNNDNNNNNNFNRRSFNSNNDSNANSDVKYSMLKQTPNFNARQNNNNQKASVTRVKTNFN